jgi:hypothetical protein
MRCLAWTLLAIVSGSCSATAKGGMAREYGQGCKARAVVVTEHLPASEVGSLIASGYLPRCDRIEGFPVDGLPPTSGPEVYWSDSDGVVILIGPIEDVINLLTLVSRLDVDQSSVGGR